VVSSRQSVFHAPAAIRRSAPPSACRAGVRKASIDADASSTTATVWRV